MYVIEFEQGVYATSGEGDPARTLKLENALRFSIEREAEKFLSRTIKRVQSFRKFTNPKVLWVDEVCAVCGSNKNVEFVKITDCNLCEKCNKKLADSFESAMKMDRSDYPEL